MIEMELEIKMDSVGLAEVENMGMRALEVGGLDDLYYRYVTEDGTSPTTGKVHAMTQRTVGEAPLQDTDLTLDGTANKIDIDGVNYITFSVTTPESGRFGTLHIFARKAQE